FIMSMDNVLGVAAASGGDLRLLVFGLIMSMAIVMWMGSLVAELINRFWWLSYVGAAVIAWTGAMMMLHDCFVTERAEWLARSLAARTVQSLLFPSFGHEPGGDRVVQYILFMAVMLATYRLVRIVTRQRLAALIAILFFGVHTVNAYTTYDVAFAPELIYTFFYICGVIAYLHYRNSHQTSFFILSIAFLLACLASKEAAVTLRLMLVILYIVVCRTSFR